jgi:hypothetical protein
MKSENAKKFLGLLTAAEESEAAHSAAEAKAATATTHVEAAAAAEVKAATHA